MTRDSLPTGEGTSANDDVADPHPSTEENYDKIKQSGGSNPPDRNDSGTNSYAHGGKAPPHGDGKARNGKA